MISMVIKQPTAKEILERAKSRLGGINKTIEHIREDMDRVVAGIGGSNERHQKRDIGFVVKSIMNVESSYTIAHQICKHSPTDEGIAECIQSVTEIRDTAIDNIVDALLPALS